MTNKILIAVAIAIVVGIAIYLWNMDRNDAIDACMKHGSSYDVCSSEL